ncbi:MAG: radical SAM protein [Lachnospiraceae bacterium]|nr:radical SAM protein [Lachnospiraceae bacterium]MBF1003772.1 radical SAM protein [Lachnospiraceae bacterium]
MQIAEYKLKEKYEVMSKLSGPIAVSFDITNKCNLKCLHCYNNSGSSQIKELSDSQVIEVGRQIAELHPLSVCLCGGETLCRENILDLMDVLKDEVGAISMVSNGFLITKEKAAELKKRELEQIQISIDGINQYQHDSFRQVKGSFEHAINAVKVLKDAGIKAIATSFVPNKLNYKSINEYIEMCMLLGIDVVRMMPFIPSGRGRTIGESLILSKQEYFLFLRDVQNAITEYGEKIIVEWGDPLDHMRRMPFNAKNGLKSYCMEIKANGDITVTTYLPIVVGNCMRYTLKEYWDGGYNMIWDNKYVLSHLNKIQTVDDFVDFIPRPYEGEKILIDLL